MSETLDRPIATDIMQRATERVRLFLSHEDSRGTLKPQKDRPLSRYKLRHSAGNRWRKIDDPTNCFSRSGFRTTARLARELPKGGYETYEYDDEKAKSLIDDALRGSQIHIDAMDSIIEDFVFCGRAPTVELWRYISHRLKDSRERSASSRGRPKINEKRDFVIAYAVYDTAKVFKLPYGANDATISPTTASQVVSDALAQLGIELKPASVNKIWSRQSSDVAGEWNHKTQLDWVGSCPGGKRLWSYGEPRSWG